MSWLLKWLIGEPQYENPQEAEDEKMEEELHNSIERHKYAILKLKRSGLNDIEDSIRAHDLLEDVLSKVMEREVRGDERRS